MCKTPRAYTVIWYSMKQGQPSAVRRDQERDVVSKKKHVNFISGA